MCRIQFCCPQSLHCGRCPGLTFLFQVCSLKQYLTHAPSPWRHSFFEFGSFEMIHTVRNIQSFSVWLLSLNIMSSRSNDVVAVAGCPSSRPNSVPWSMWRPHPFPSVHWRAPRWFLHLSYYEWCCSARGRADVSSMAVSLPLHTYPEVESLDCMAVLVLVSRENFILWLSRT